MGPYIYRLLLVCFEGLGSDSHRVFSRFVRGSREISSASSLYRESIILYRLSNTQIMIANGNIILVTYVIFYRKCSINNS